MHPRTPSLLSAFVAIALAAGAQGPVTNSIGMLLVPIAPGRFTMGQDGPAADYHMTRHPAKFDDADWDERPAHPVTISRPFHLGATEVTLGQYRRFRPDFRRDDGDDDEAVRDVSWNDAAAFCSWLSEKEGRPYRLPTEAEWEYACRAGTTTLFHTGDALPAGHQKWFRDDNGRARYFTGPAMPAEYERIAGAPVLRVARTTPNAWGLYDMHGNVAEWCADWYGPYEAGAQTDPTGRSDGDFRVFRGGAHSSFVRLLRSANRGAWIPESRDRSIGFRVALGDPPKTVPLPPPPPPLNARDVDPRTAAPAAPPSDAPFFDGPKVFVKIPPDACGPLYAWHNHSPAIAECPNGDLLAVWYSCVDEAGSELNNLASRLRRGAAEWEEASPFWDGADVNDHAPKLWWDGDRTIFHLVRGLAENIVRTSTDNGATWSKARVVMPHGEFGNQLIRTRAGVLAITHDVRTAGLVTSRDGGRTWEGAQFAERDTDLRPGATGRRPPGIHSPIAELDDGRLMAFTRQDAEEDQARFHGRMPVSHSADGGRTWTFAESEFPAISTVQRPVLLRLREGPLLLCSYTDQSRDGRNRRGMTFRAADGSTFTGYGLFAAVSLDEGRTWPHRRLVTPGDPARERPSIDRAVATFSGTRSERCGYLAAVQTRDGNIQLISSRNHYAFNLAWLKARPPPPASAASNAPAATPAPARAPASDGPAAKTGPAARPAVGRNVVVFKEPGRYGGWPANHGIWAWSNEIVVGFTAAWYKPATNDHAVDRARPSEDWQARSLDGGETWTVEKPPALARPPGAPPAPRLPEPLDFTAPDFALTFRFASLHVGPTVFFVSADRCRSWRGPYAFAVDGVPGIAARTDYLVSGPRECLMFGSAAKVNRREGRPFCARTTDGGRTWKLVGRIGPEPDGFAIMPSSARLKDGALLTTIRHVDPGRPATIDAYRSENDGKSWRLLGEAAHDNGGNPPSLVTLPDGRLCVTYGYRRKPYGIRARVSADDGRTWGPEIVVRGDGLTGDLGYPRSIVRPDGRVLTVYYFNGPRDEDRAIEATIWQP